MRWLGDVDQDSDRVGERNWKRQARNKDEWKKLLSNTRAHPELSSQWC
jgi:hypothetical protein